MSSLVEIKYISPKKGRGIFAKRFIRKYTIIDNSHLIFISNDEYKLIENTILGNYLFVWDDPDREKGYDTAICMSYCQFINHSYTPNVKYQYDYEIKTIEFITIKDIEKGEELTINYMGKPEDKKAVWFDMEED